MIVGIPTLSCCFHSHQQFLLHSGVTARYPNQHALAQPSKCSNKDESVANLVTKYTEDLQGVR